MMNRWIKYTFQGSWFHGIFQIPTRQPFRSIRPAINCIIPSDLAVFVISSAWMDSVKLAVICLRIDKASFRSSGPTCPDLSADGGRLPCNQMKSEVYLTWIKTHQIIPVKSYFRFVKFRAHASSMLCLRREVRDTMPPLRTGLILVRDSLKLAAFPEHQNV